MRPNRLAALAMLAMVAPDFAWPARKEPRPFTHADEERIRKADEKRARKAAKRRKLAGKEPGGPQWLSR